MINIKNNYNHTFYASYIGFITQAIVNNFAPLLFLTFQRIYEIPLHQITLLITINFGVQLTVDLFSVKFADKIGYRPLMVFAHICAAIGLAGLGLFPLFFTEAYIGLLAAVIIYAIGGGLTDVLISPIVEACPTVGKSAKMSLTHSFYCWGKVFVILGSTLFFIIFGIDNWKILAGIWALIPLVNTFYFSQVPIFRLTDKNSSMRVRQLLSMKVFWIFVLLMICAAAAEISMAQWASAFAESEFGVSKTVGDLAGPLAFAIFMGIARVAYSKFSNKINLRAFMIYSGALSVTGYLLAALSPYPALSLIACGLCGLAAGILWPGTLSLAAERFPKGGTAIFAMLALAGHLGALFGPTVVGFVSHMLEGNIRMGLLAAVVFPLLMTMLLLMYKRQDSNASTV